MIQKIGNKLSLKGVMYLPYIHVRLKGYLVVGLDSFTWWYLSDTPISHPHPTILFLVKNYW